MRYILLFICAAFSISCSVHSHSSSPTDTESYRSTGTITAIDIDKGLVTLDHDDIPGYMPAMEMTVDVIEPKMLYSFRIGDIVDFDLERNGSTLLVTNLVRKGTDKTAMGRAVYRVNCTECHGVSGEGASKGIPLISGHALHHSEAEFIETVGNGKALKSEKPMPAFREKLSELEIRAVVAFIRNSLQKGKQENKGSHDHQKE